MRVSSQVRNKRGSWLSWKVHHGRLCRWGAHATGAGHTLRPHIARSVQLSAVCGGKNAVQCTRGQCAAGRPGAPTWRAGSRQARVQASGEPAGFRKLCGRRGPLRRAHRANLNVARRWSVSWLCTLRLARRPDRRLNAVGSGERARYFVCQQAQGPPRRLPPSPVLASCRLRRCPARLPCCLHPHAAPNITGPTSLDEHATHPAHVVVQAQASALRQSGGVLDAVIQGYVSDGIITREEAASMSPDQLEFLIRKRTRNSSSAPPPAAHRAPSPPPSAAPAQVRWLQARLGLRGLQVSTREGCAVLTQGMCCSRRRQPLWQQAPGLPCRTHRHPALRLS